MDRGDIGLIGGGGLGAIIAVMSGFGTAGIAVTTLFSAYAGHKLGGSCYSSGHSYK